MAIFVYKGFDQKPGNRKYLRLSFVQYLETGVSQRLAFGKFGIIVSNEKLLDAAKCQVSSSYRFRVIKELFVLESIYISIQASKYSNES